MKFAYASDLMSKAVRQRNFSYIVAGAMALSNIILCAKLYNHDERWILIPQFDVDHRLEVRSSGFSDQYLMDWAEHITRHLLTVNKHTIARNSQDVLKITSSAFNRLKKQFDAQARDMASNGITTAFYPSDFTIDKSKATIKVTGKFLTFFGEDKAPVIEVKTYTLGWEINGRGCIFLTQFQEDKQHHES